MPPKVKKTKDAAPVPGTKSVIDALGSHGHGTWCQKRQAWMSTISNYFRSDEHADITQEPALPLVSKDPKDKDELLGYIEPFNADVLKQKFNDYTDKETPFTFTCGGSALWIDPMASINQFIPVMPSKVDDLIQVMFDAPRQCSLTFDVVLSWNVTRGSPPFGKLVLASPPEPFDALLKAVAERIEAKADKTEMAGWHRVLRSVTMRFIQLDSDDDKYYHQLQSRQEKVQEAQTVTLSTVQECFDIWGFKLRKEAANGGVVLSAKAVADE